MWWLTEIVLSPANEAEPTCQARGSGVPGDLSSNRHVSYIAGQLFGVNEEMT